MTEMSIQEVLKFLPHRYPFLLVDRVSECEVGVRIRGHKNVTYNEPFFQGHFPAHPVFPGVLIIEALAQATGLLTFRTMGVHPGDNMLYLFVGVDNARFKRRVGPGDRLDLSVDLLRSSRGIWKFQCEASVDGEVACVAELMGAVREVQP